jgi:hypothetical protein
MTDNSNLFGSRFSTKTYLKALEQLVGLLRGEEQLVSGEKGDGVHEQSDPEVFGRQLGPEQGVEQGRSATVVSFIHHPTTRVRNKIQEYLGEI